MAISALSNTSHIALHRMYRHRKYRQPTPAKPAITIVMPIYYSRPVDSPPADLYFAPVFLLFLFNESPQKRPKAVWCHIWQDVGPDWEGHVHKFQTYPSVQGFFHGVRKTEQKVCIFGQKIFHQKRFIMGRLTSKVSLIISVAP